MKFLVLALCVCAASAASFGEYNPYSVQATAKVGASPFTAAGSSRFASQPAPVVKAEVNQVVAPVPVGKAAVRDAEAVVVKSDSEISADGSFKQQYETSNRIFAESSGVLKSYGDTKALVVTGSYRYYTPEGTPVEVTYVADENGFQPKSDSLPVGPPIPEDIARAVEYVLKYGKPEPEKY